MFGTDCAGFYAHTGSQMNVRYHGCSPRNGTPAEPHQNFMEIKNLEIYNNRLNLLRKYGAQGRNRTTDTRIFSPFLR